MFGLFSFDWGETHGDVLSCGRISAAETRTSKPLSGTRQRADMLVGSSLLLLECNCCGRWMLQEKKYCRQLFFLAEEGSVSHGAGSLIWCRSAQDECLLLPRAGCSSAHGVLSRLGFPAAALWAGRKGSTLPVSSTSSFAAAYSVYRKMMQL